MSEADHWRRRERALGAGLVVWVVTLTFVLTLEPDAVAEFLTTNEPALTASAILVTVGLCGGIAEGILLLADEYTGETDDEGLTRVPWDE